MLEEQALCVFLEVSRESGKVYPRHSARGKSKKPRMVVWDPWDLSSDPSKMRTWWRDFARGVDGTIYIACFDTS